MFGPGVIAFLRLRDALLEPVEFIPVIELPQMHWFGSLVISIEEQYQSSLALCQQRQVAAQVVVDLVKKTLDLERR